MLPLLLILGSLTQAAGGSTAYTDCLRENVPLLEASGESASDVARAAVTLCARHETRPTANNVLGQMTPADREEVLRGLRETFENRVLLHVVRLRACRLTAGCRAADLPNPYGVLE